MPDHTPSLYIGLMSGTSIDSIDCALIEVDGENITLIDTVQGEIPSDIRQEIQALNAPTDNELYRSLALSKSLAYLFAKCVKQLLAQCNLNPNDIQAIGSHGQTLRHQPNGKLGFTLQIGDPSTIAENTAITVVADFRSRDIAAGGQGAPLVPLFHHALFGCASKNRAIVNIGGIANITHINHAILQNGFDSGPGNVLMDYWCQQHQNTAFDINGQWGSQGRILDALLSTMRQDPYFKKTPPKSTGREYFNQTWLKQFSLQRFLPVDVMSTFAELTAITISEAIETSTDEVFICGGGANNSFLMDRIQQHCQQPVHSTNAIGVNPDYVEAMAFAWLAHRRLNHLPGNAPLSTGAMHPCILGGVYAK